MDSTRSYIILYLYRLPRFGKHSYFVNTSIYLSTFLKVSAQKCLMGDAELY